MEEIRKSKLSSRKTIQCQSIVSPICYTLWSSHGPVFSLQVLSNPLSTSWIYGSLQNEIMVVSGSPINKGKGNVKTR